MSLSLALVAVCSLATGMDEVHFSQVPELAAWAAKYHDIDGVETMHYSSPMDHSSGKRATFILRRVRFPNNVQETRRWISVREQDLRMPGRAWAELCAARWDEGLGAGPGWQEVRTQGGRTIRVGLSEQEVRQREAAVAENSSANGRIDIACGEWFVARTLAAADPVVKVEHRDDGLMHVDVPSHQLAFDVGPDYPGAPFLVRRVENYDGEGGLRSRDLLNDVRSVVAFPTPVAHAIDRHVPPGGVAAPLPPASTGDGMLAFSTYDLLYIKLLPTVTPERAPVATAPASPAPTELAAVGGSLTPSHDSTTARARWPWGVAITVVFVGGVLVYLKRRG
jgi:hypothetical protein